MEKIHLTFLDIPDPRVLCRCDHLLSDILLIAICTYLVGGSDYQDIVVFGQERGKSLDGLLKLPNGVPSHDTFSRVFSMLKSDSLQECQMNHGRDILSTLSEKQKQEIVARLDILSAMKFMPMQHTLGTWPEDIGALKIREVA